MYDIKDLRNKLFVISNTKDKKEVDLNRIIERNQSEYNMSSYSFKEGLTKVDRTNKMIFSVLLSKYILSLTNKDDLEDDVLSFSLSKNPSIRISINAINETFEERFKNFKQNINNLSFEEYLDIRTMTYIFDMEMDLFNNIYVVDTSGLGLKTLYNYLKDITLWAHDDIEFTDINICEVYEIDTDFIHFKPFYNERYINPPFACQKSIVRENDMTIDFIEKYLKE